MRNFLRQFEIAIKSISSPYTNHCFIFSSSYKMERLTLVEPETQDEHLGVENYLHICAKDDLNVEPEESQPIYIFKDGKPCPPPEEPESPDIPPHRRAEEIKLLPQDLQDFLFQLHEEMYKFRNEDSDIWDYTLRDFQPKFIKLTTTLMSDIRYAALTHYLADMLFTLMIRQPNENLSELVDDLRDNVTCLVDLCCDEYFIRY